MCVCICMCMCFSVCVMICQATFLQTKCVRNRVGEMTQRNTEVLLTEGGKWMLDRQRQQVPDPRVPTGL